MKKLIFSLLTMFVAVLQINATVADNVIRVVGGDISLVPAYEAAGDDWLDDDGNPITATYNDGMITYLRDVAGWNAARVRILVDPTLDDAEGYDEYLATCQDLDYVKALGKRIKDAGMYFLLDIFYSDTWTDVSKQWIPESWGMDKSTATETLAAQVKSYTTDVINELVAYGAAPDYVQLGNEVSYGMLWDSFSGKSNSSHFFNLSSSYSDQKTKIDRFASLLNAGAEGVRESNAPSAKIVLHSERSGNSTQTKNFYDYVQQGGFADYDVIGLSYYPAWQGSLSNLESTISSLISAYPDKEIQIVETGYYAYSDVSAWLSTSELNGCTWNLSPAGQAQFLSDLTTMLNNYTNVTGFYYWQPEECGNGADSDGNNRVKGNWDYRGFWELSWKSESHPLISEDALMTVKNFNHTALDVNSEDGIDAILTSLSESNSIYNIQGMRVCDTSKNGLYIINGKKVLVK
ncbi:MAG: arabinogalactan endo-1,4-beta-galactosidase [Prevotella sp.]|nr:arabinogalactan endo-1,4-beta-galactosidase [Prevotella sp.]